VRGRDPETQLISEMLHRGRTGTGGVILVEGAPGMGKSLLLAEAAKAATALGYTTVAAVADEFERMIPLCPLLLALEDVAGRGYPQAYPADPADLTDLTEPDPRTQAVTRVRRCLERLAAQGPVLVTVDDLQHADPVTVLALRVLPRQLAVRPVSWILARATEEHTDAARLFDLLDHDGADRMPLQPLADAAVADVITDLLGVAPERSLLALASTVGGNPLLVAELLRGLREENLLLTSPTGATVAAGHLPRRVRAFYQQRIGGLAPRTRQLIEVSAVLGRSFAVEDVAEMLGEQPASVLPAISEALAAGIFAPAGEALTFRDGMAWRAVAESVPASLSRALHHQAGQLFLDHGNAVRAAEHLVPGPRPGDRLVLRELDEAMRKVLPGLPAKAADLAMRALELTPPDDPQRGGRVVVTVRALLAARRLEEAETLIAASLTGSPLPAQQRAQLRGARVALRGLRGQPGRVRAEAEELLADPDLPASVRDDVTVSLLHALGELPDIAAAEQRSRAIVRQAVRLRGSDRPSAAIVAAAKALRATVQWNHGHVAASLDLLREAVSGTPGGPTPARTASLTTAGGPAAGFSRQPYRPLLILAARLIDVRLIDEATTLINVPCADDDPASLAVAQVGPALLRARMHLAGGRIEAAQSEAEAVLGADRAADDSPHALLARCMLGVIALRRGDLASASQALDRVSARLADAGSGSSGVLCQLLAAQVADARDGPDAALSIAADVYDLVRGVRWPLIHDPSVAPWLVRTALAAGDTRRAAQVGSAAAELARLNPGFPVVTAACAHARGLLGNDTGLLEFAARTQPDPWAAASAAADLAALLADAHRVTEAVELLDLAHDNFLASGASRDAARARGMLRALGVRRGRWRAAQRPARATGIDGLSETERGIAELVCQGLTNREIAERTFVSANTVAFHLRNIYRKLRIASRVQLTRIILDARTSPPPAP
jgi:DNA-binding CsgD family transcriptional regulator